MPRRVNDCMQLLPCGYGSDFFQQLVQAFPLKKAELAPAIDRFCVGAYSLLIYSSDVSATDYYVSTWQYLPGDDVDYVYVRYRYLGA